MKVFVTGGAGYIGSVACELLIEAGHEVVVFDSLKSGHRSALHHRARLIEGDILDPECLYRSLKGSAAEAVMHFASEIVVSESYQNPSLHFQVNLCGGVNLLEAMAQCGVKRLVFSSTAGVYGEPKETPITEDSPCVPVSPYGESKLLFERLLPWHERIHGLKHVSLRYFNACGATERNGEDRPVETHLIPILFDVAAGKRQGFMLYGDDYPTPDGTCIRDYIHVSDIARAHLLVLEELDELEPTAFNLGTGQGHSNRQVLAAVEKATGKKIAHDVEPRRQGDPAMLVASPDKIKHRLGWKPQITSLDAMIQSAWDWRMAHPNGYED